MNLFLLLIMSLAGGIGAVIRWYVCRWAADAHPRYAYYAMFAVNIVGSFLIGFTASALTHHLLPPWVGAVITTGLCGGFTSLSTVQLDAVKLWKNHHTLLAIINVSLNVGSSWALCCLGAALGAL